MDSVARQRYGQLVELTTQSVLRDFIVLALGSLGGTAKRADVLIEMDRLFGGFFTSDDRKTVRTRPSEEAWRNRASFERADMVRDGFLAVRAGGIWELDRAGRDHLVTLGGPPAPAEPYRVDPLRNFSPKDSTAYLAHLAGQILVKSRAHESLVKDYGLWARRQGFTPLTLHPRDLVLQHPGGEWLVEAKMLYDGNATEAVRAATGQLLSYRHFFYTVSKLALPSLLALFSEDVGAAYVEFLESLSIASVWRSTGSWAGSRSAVAAGLAIR
jgi:hypothetical protein